jgi:hypothetical protein
MGERRELAEVQSAPCADNSAAFAASKRQMKVSIKVGENAEGSAASKADLFRDSYALLILVGSLIHIDHEYWGILLTKQHDKDPVPSRFTRYFTQELPSSHDHHMELPSATFSIGNKRGIVAVEEEAKHRCEKIKRRCAHNMMQNVKEKTEQMA